MTLSLDDTKAVYGKPGGKGGWPLKQCCTLCIPGKHHDHGVDLETSPCKPL